MEQCKSNLIRLAHCLTFEDVYLLWLNDFVTVERMAEYYSIENIQALSECIELGKTHNHSKFLKKED